jgi:hypothetical protein
MSIYYQDEGMEYPERIQEESKELTLVRYQVI